MNGFAYQNGTISNYLTNEEEKVQIEENRILNEIKVDVIEQDINPNSANIISGENYNTNVMVVTKKDMENKLKYIDFNNHIAPQRNTRAYSKALEKMEGRVIDVKKGSFLAELITPEGEQIEASIKMSELSNDDIELVEPGAIFYWNIGYYINEAGQRSTMSIIRFRRLPKWYKSDIENAKAQGEKMFEEINS